MNICHLKFCFFVLIRPYCLSDFSDVSDNMPKLIVLSYPKFSQPTYIHSLLCRFAKISAIFMI